MKRFLAFFLAMALCVVSASAQAETLTVAVAANVQFAFQALRAEFKREAGIDAQSIIGSSGKLTAQIRAGAPFDVFLSADMAYPHALYEAGLATTEPRIYAYGTLVLWTLAGIDVARGLPVLTEPDVHRVAVANPKLAPYGLEAMRALAYYHLDKAVTPKLVYGDSISQVNQYIHSKAADVGITAKSVVLSPQMRSKGRWIEIPKDAYSPIAQGAVILKHGQDLHARAARTFLVFLSSPAARNILKRYGYGLP
jgi:molybdate transport system substrate-binding protein